MFFKNILPILLAIFIAFICSISAKNHEKHHAKAKKPECNCDLITDLVCASNNVTYRNECVLKKCVAKYNPDIKFLHKGRCVGDIEDEEQTMKTDNRQRRDLHNRKQVYGLHRRKSLLSKKLKQKPGNVNFSKSENVKTFVDKVKPDK